MLIALGMLMGMLLAIVLVAHATVSIWLPILARFFENDPNDPAKFAATTKVGPNKFKFKMRGGKVVSGLLNSEQFKQRGGATAPDKYEIVPLQQNEAPPQEEMGSIDAYIYRHSGYRFFNPFNEHIYIYEFARTKELMSSDGHLKVIGVTDNSDYFLLSEQTYSITITDTDTGRQENVKATLRGKVTFQIINPWKSAFGDIKWLQQSIAAIQVRGRNFVRARDFDTLLGELGKDVEEGSELRELLNVDLAKVSTQIDEGPGTEKLFGVRVSRVLIETMEMSDPEADKSRTLKYTADRKAEVVRIEAGAEADKRKTLRAADATAEAGYMRELAKEARAQGALGLKLIDQQTQVNVAKEAGTVIMQVGGDQQVDPINAQILEEIKKNAPKTQR
ncbi:MAG: hypothetical protein A2942_01330 [Candidatus Lloydbacteria bacterium RIFCSPLOWO2_01_FULL_50_20]|uniref:Band 7 domain-containing protein n=1 Tax=Candidatus Lloydbacteria bacterium RIFCSPLOWO2_01_FULL_50_20 TaxID=1798665 RepID=A0A1G2DKX7_9BACT|nr:MAG: hypothetical protein A2942_01330 [Candidatus Lloydbacteria bacterium RIFCSPLOWO2_01_FULL_50_20]